MSLQFYQKHQAFPELKRNLTVGINSLAQIIIQLNKVDFLHLSKKLITTSMMILVRQRSLKMFPRLETLSKMIENTGSV